jgi:hypothetical protein
MKESYGEGLANHTSLESCGNCSNVVAEALTEGSTGGLLSSEINSFRVPTTWSDGEGNTFYSVMRALERPGGVLELGMCGHSLRGNRDIHMSFTNRKVMRNGQ